MEKTGKSLKMEQYDCNRKFFLPTFGSQYSVGIDVYLPESILIKAKDYVVVPLNIWLDIPHGYYVGIQDKSSKAAKGVTIGGGIIDSDYYGEVSVILYNFNSYDIGFGEGEKICQFILDRVYIESDVGEMRSGGFGSTGDKSAEC